MGPGGHIGRFVIYTPSAFGALDNIFGTSTQSGVEKGGYNLNRTSMECADLARIINSDQVQSKLRAVRTSVRAHDKTKKNPLKNRSMMQKMNPNANAAVAQEAAAQKARIASRAAAIKHSRSKAGQAEK